MRTKSIKKLLTVTLATAMVMASALTVCATTDSNSGSSSSSSSTSSASSSSSEESTTATTYAEAHSASASTAISVAGSSVTTSVAGVYAAEKVQGCAVTTPVASLSAALGLASGEKAAIIIYDTDEEKSNMAMVSVNAAIEALGGGDMVASLNIDLGAKKAGKWVTLSSGSVGMQVGLPKAADTTKTYSIICVQPGGVTTVLEDQDVNPKTVTFDVQAGLGTYAIVAR